MGCCFSFLSPQEGAIEGGLLPEPKKKTITVLQIPGDVQTRLCEVTLESTATGRDVVNHIRGNIAPFGHHQLTLRGLEVKQGKTLEELGVGEGETLVLRVVDRE